MSSEEQQQQQQVVDDGYSSSDDEWTRPATKKDEDETANNENSTNIAKVDYSWNEDEQALAGNAVTIIFKIEELNDPSAAPRTLGPVQFVMGQTIAHLKSFLADTNGIEYNRQTMILGDRELIDPLSLNDLGFQSGSNTVNEVIVRLI